MFKAMVIIYMILDLMHSYWIEEELIKYRDE